MLTFKLSTLAAALCFIGAAGGQSQTGDPYAGKINAYVQGTRDTYEHVRNWIALTEREHEAADRGVVNALSSAPDPVGDLHPESVVPCGAEPSERLRAVCRFYEKSTLSTAHLKTNPDYVRGQFDMLRMINNCQAPGIPCAAEIVITPPFGR